MLVLVAVPMLSAMALVGAAGDMKVIRTTNVGDVVVTVLGATDGWTTGDNAFALEFDSAQRKRLVDVDLIDPAVFVKAVIKEGVLQEHNGIGVAIEAGPLLPSTVRGERGAGFEAIGIVSGRVAPFTVHVNVGGGIDRSAAKPFSLW